MTDLEQKIFNDISSCNEFHYSESLSDKMLEIEAIKNLISNALIVKTSENILAYIYYLFPMYSLDFLFKKW